MQTLFRVRDTRTGKIVDEDFYLDSQGVVNYYNCTTEELIERDHLIVEQWTGLTDCNGVKIFEGDRVSTNWGATGKILWRDKNASFSIFIEAEPPFHSKHFPLDDKCVEVLNDPI